MFEDVESPPKILSTPQKMIRKSKTIGQTEEISLSKTPKSRKEVKKETMIKTEISNNDELKQSELDKSTKELVKAENTTELEDYMKDYKPLDPIFFEKLKATPNLVFIRNEKGFYYGQLTENSVRNGRGRSLF